MRYKIRYYITMSSYLDLYRAPSKVLLEDLPKSILKEIRNPGLGSGWAGHEHREMTRATSLSCFYLLHALFSWLLGFSQDKYDQFQAAAPSLYVAGRVEIWPPPKILTLRWTYLYLVSPPWMWVESVVTMGYSSRDFVASCHMWLWTLTCG